MIKVTIENEGANVALVEINGDTRKLGIEWVDGVPRFPRPCVVGVLLGRSGVKIWRTIAPLGPLTGGGYGLVPWSPLNSINRGFASVRVVDWWDKIPEDKKSKR